jgi:hypothetical protein
MKAILDRVSGRCGRVLVALLLITAAPSFAQRVDEIWSKEVGFTVDEVNAALVDGPFLYVCGTKRLSTTQSVAFINKYAIHDHSTWDAGDLVSSVTWPPSPDGLYHGKAIAINLEGIGIPDRTKVYMAVQAPVMSADPPHSDYVLLRFDVDISGGTEALSLSSGWSTPPRYNNGTGLDDVPVKMLIVNRTATQLEYDTVVVTGWSEGYMGSGSSWSGKDYATVGWAAGSTAPSSPVWVRRLNGANDSDDVPVAMSLGADNSVVVTGTVFHVVAEDSPPISEFMTMSYFAGDGSDYTGWSSSGERYDRGNDQNVATSLARLEKVRIGTVHLVGI